MNVPNNFSSHGGRAKAKTRKCQTGRKLRGRFFKKKSGLLGKLVRPPPTDSQLKLKHVVVIINLVRIKLNGHLETMLFEHFGLLPASRVSRKYAKREGLHFNGMKCIGFRLQLSASRWTLFGLLRRVLG